MNHAFNEQLTYGMDAIILMNIFIHNFSFD